MARMRAAESWVTSSGVFVDGADEDGPALADGVADAEDEGGVDDADEDGPALAEGSDVGAVDTADADESAP